MMAAGAGHRAPSATLYASGGGPAPRRRTGPRPDCGVGSGGGCRVELGEDVVERIVEPGEARRFLSSPIPTVHSATCDRGEGVAAGTAGEEHGVTGGVRVEDAEEQMPARKLTMRAWALPLMCGVVASAAAMSRSSRWSSRSVALRDSGRDDAGGCAGVVPARL